jgi:hypothetical protein
MNVQGRTLNAYICQNVDGTQFGAVLDVSNNIANIGKVGWSLDAQVTETTIADCDIELFDPNNTIWTWTKTNLPSAEGNLPGFLIIVFGGAVVYYGIINFNEIFQDSDSNSIHVQSHSWFSMAALEILNSTDQNGNPTAWSRQPIPIPVTRTQTTDTGTSLPMSIIWLNGGDGGGEGDDGGDGDGDGGDGGDGGGDGGGGGD